MSCPSPNGTTALAHRKADGHRESISAARHTLPISGRQDLGWIRAAVSAQTRCGEIPKSWIPDLGKSDRLGSESRAPVTVGGLKKGDNGGLRLWFEGLVPFDSGRQVPDLFGAVLPAQLCRIEIPKTDLEISDLVGSESRSPDPDVDGDLYMGPKEGVMTSQATESASVLTVPTMMAGASGLALNSSEFGTPDPIEGSNGGRSLGVIVGVKVPAAATTRKDVDLPTPTSGSRRGTRIGSDLLYGSDRSGKQKSEPSSGGFGSPVERNACIGSPMPALVI